ncbi:ferric reductase-like transmembrane domain-containing protein [Alcanivorax sp. JB21]|uniref:ferric reductase-like transmembrane domain-containing protein n=1 Tax=Alcanivorax limicola TaxID=2874102 RepID=UPI001CBB1950|nr:ferric reductase-like transmembrane domain-containing protein [Alcanivorax limicola]MBZ2190573.1 ferric reductase-like transmembrane domain-containing protein [Alcanivorax limicola]
MTSGALRRLWLIWPLGLVPLVVVVWQGLSGALGPDPVLALISRLGWWGLLLLVLTLAARPLAVITRRGWLVALRRPLGLLAFGYICLHLLAWAGLLLGWDPRYIGPELVERPYIVLGMLAWLLLLPLAVTSTRRARRRLGRRWGQLHQLIFPAILLGLAHQWWIQKSDYTEPVLFSLVVVALFGWRWWNRRVVAAVADRKKVKKPPLST